jgi:hypothetical protein
MLQPGSNVKLTVFGVVCTVLLLVLGIAVLKIFILDDIVHTVSGVCGVTSCSIWQCNATCTIMTIQYHMYYVADDQIKPLIANTTRRSSGCTSGNAGIGSCTIAGSCNETIKYVLCDFYDTDPAGTITLDKPAVPFYGIWTFVTICVVLVILIAIVGFLIGMRYNRIPPHEYYTIDDSDVTVQTEKNETPLQTQQIWRDEHL